MVSKNFPTYLLLLAAILFLTRTLQAQCVAPTFSAPISFDLGAFPTDIVAADLNGDTRVDLVIPVLGTNEVHILLGNEFGPPTRMKITSVQAPVAAGVGDFNHDAKLDLAISRGTINQQMVAILLGDGMGGFSSPVEFVASLTRPMVIADFNNDTNLDIFLGNESTNNSQILLGNGVGGFAAPFAVVVPNNSQAIAADFNTDGKIDLATVADGSFVSVLLGNGLGGFSSTTHFPVSRARFIATADFNADNKLDLVTAGQTDGVSLLLGNGAGSFGAPTAFSTGFETFTVGAGDFNGDGRADIVTSSSGFIAILINSGSGALGSPTNYILPTSTTPTDIAVADFNGDSKVDIATANSSGTATLLTGKGTGMLVYPSILSTGGNAVSVIAGDINGDNKTDLIAGNIGQNASSFLGDGNGGFGPASTILLGFQSTPSALADLNGDNKVDLITANPDGFSISILSGDGAGGFGQPQTINTGGFNPSHVVTGDFNNDGRTDIAVVNRSSSFVSILLANPAGGFGMATNFAVPDGGQQAVIGDLNADGTLDLVVATIPGVAILLGNSSGGFGASTVLPTPSSVASVTVDDFNSDGRADIAAAITNQNAVWVYQGNGQGGFGANAAFTTGGGPSWLVSSDFNSDGNIDVVVSNHTGTASVLAGDGLGGFGAAQHYVVGGPVPRKIVSADFNSDSRPDFAVASQGGNVLPFGAPPGVISVLLNTCTASPMSPPMVSISDVSVTEDNSGSVTASFAVMLPFASSKTVTASFYSLAIDAAKDADYQSALGSVVFAPGMTTQTINVSVNGDLLDEFDEKFKVILRTPLNAVIGRAEGVATIIDDDSPPTISINDVTIKEGNSGSASALFPVFLSAASGKPISISIATSDDTGNAPGDYTSISLILNFAPGQVAQVVPVSVLGDTTVEPDERFVVNLSSPTNVTLADGQAAGFIGNDDTSLQFSAASFAVDESAPAVNITVTRAGDTASATSFDYVTTDTDNFTVNCGNVAGNAFARCDFATSVDTLIFAPGETAKTFSIPIINDSIAEGNETFGVTLSNVTGGATLDSPSTATITINDNDAVTGPNPIFTTPFFVRQHYLDFLSREPEPSEPWSGVLNGCSDVNNNPACDRLTVSGAIFGSPEFSLKGLFAYRFYKVAFNRLPLYSEIVVDMRAVTGATPAETFQKKATFTNNFVTLAEFVNLYNGLSNLQYVNTLMDRYSLTSIRTPDPSAPDGRNKVTLTSLGLINRLNGIGGALTRAQVLRAIADSDEVTTAEANQGFVAMQYYGYLRRTPDTPGFNSWINHLNANPTDFRTMVNGFMNSSEYRLRFGPAN